MKIQWIPSGVGVAWKPILKTTLFLDTAGDLSVVLPSARARREVSQHGRSMRSDAPCDPSEV